MRHRSWGSTESKPSATSTRYPGTLARRRATERVYALSILKSRTVLFAAALAIGLSTTAAHAQFHLVEARFNAPFGFEYGSQHLPAGKYAVSREADHLTLLRGETNGAMELTQTVDEKAPAARGKVVFRKYGERYFLSEVWIPGKTIHLSITPTKAEKRLVVAMNGAVPANVEVAMVEPPR